MNNDSKMVVFDSSQTIEEIEEVRSDWGRPKGSLFLAGPTPRDGSEGWRPKALDILNNLGYNGIVYVPEPFAQGYDKQIGWEWKFLEESSIRLFWIPRELEKMPAFTTNIEFGHCVISCKERDNFGTIYGRPDDAPKISYLDWHYKRVAKEEPYNDLKLMLAESVKRLRKLDTMWFIDR